MSERLSNIERARRLRGEHFLLVWRDRDGTPFMQRYRGPDAEKWAEWRLSTVRLADPDAKCYRISERIEEEL